MGSAGLLIATSQASGGAHLSLFLLAFFGALAV